MGGMQTPRQTPRGDARFANHRASLADSRRLSLAVDDARSANHRASLTDGRRSSLAEEVRAAGHEVTPKMIAFAQHEARITNYKDGTNMLEQVRKVLLREAAKAYVCSVSIYKRQGLNLILSLSSLEGETLEMKVNREVSIADVAGMVQATVGKAREVKLVRPNGTLLPSARAIGDVLDHESEEVLPNEEDSVFYPLATLTGEMWKEMGLHGPTRWKHMREDEFKDLFGMSKNSFDKLQPWAQMSLKKKHGLF